MKQLLIRLAASGALAAVAGVGLAQASNNSINDTGPYSVNQITTNNSSHDSGSTHGQPNVVVINSNNQSGQSRGATVSGNTFGGSAHSGSVNNSNQTSTNVSVTTPSMGGSWNGGNGGSNNSISNTGPGSVNTITENNHSNWSGQNNQNGQPNVVVINSNNQSGQSRGATVSGNTFGGNATSGSVNNSNSTWTSIDTVTGGNAWVRGGNGNGGSNSISNTGPGSYNSITVNGNGPKRVYGSNLPYNHTTYNHNPWMAAAVSGYSIRKYDQHGYGMAMYNRYPSVDYANYHSHGNLYSQPCNHYRTVNYRTIRPPCYPVHKVYSPCGHRNQRCCDSQCCHQQCHPVHVPKCHHVCHHQSCQHHCGRVCC